MKLRFHAFLLMVFILSGINTMSLLAQNRYKTDLLANMAEASKYADQMDDLEDGCYRADFAYKKRIMNVVVEQGVVTHIGYLLFSESQRELMPTQTVFNFLERYALSIDLPLKREKNVEKQLAEDNISFTVGEMSDLTKLAKDTTLSITVDNLADKHYKVSWHKGEKTVCSINFPVSYDLLNGTDIVENERRIVEVVMSTKPLTPSNAKVNAKELIKSWQPNYYILPGDTCYTEQLSTNLYYEKSKEGEYRLIFDRQRPTESLANMLTTVDVDNDFKIKVRLRKYDVADEPFEVSVLQFVSHFLKQGCTLYFGLHEYEETTAVCELLIRNAAEGYCHILKIHCDVEQLLDKKGEMTARMTSYIPISKIKNLFQENEY